MIEVNHISKRIGSKEVLKDLSFELARNRVTAVCGPNGAGKTTLVRLILGLLNTDQGTIDFKLDRRRISFLFHNSCLFSDLSLKENLSFFLASKNITLDQETLDGYLKEFSLQDELDAKVSTFSQGMLQKADLIRTLMEKPDFLVLDEPTSNLDPLGKVEVRKILKRLVVEKKLTIFLTSHLLGEVEKFADDILILNRGTLVWQGSMEEDVLKNNTDLESLFLKLLDNASGGKNAN